MSDIREMLSKSGDEHSLCFANILFIAFIAFQEINDIACVAIKAS